MLLVVGAAALITAFVRYQAPSSRAPAPRPRRPARDAVLELPALRMAERRAMDLLRSVVNPEEWAMFSDLGFICVEGGGTESRGGPRHRYLIYPHSPVVALLPGSLTPVREYCILFPELDDQVAALPAGDDMVAKWMTLRGDEDRVLTFANVSSAGCEIPLHRVERDLDRLRRWESGRGGRPDSAGYSQAAT